MKKLLCFFGLLISLASAGQTINDMPIDSLKSPHILIVGTGKIFSSKVNIEIDFGQNDNIWKTGDLRVIDKNGKKMDFNSMVDALNFLTKFNYEFVQAYVVTVPGLGGGQNVYHYLMRRK